MLSVAGVSPKEAPAMTVNNFCFTTFVAFQHSPLTYFAIKSLLLIILARGKIGLMGFKCGVDRNASFAALKKARSVW